MEKLQYEGLVLLDSWAQLRGAAVAEKRSLGCYCTNEEEAKKQRNADDLFGAARRSPPRRPANKPQNHTQTTRRRIWHAGSKQLTLSWCMWQQPCHACVVGQPASCTVHRHQHVFLAVRLAGGLLREREMEGTWEGRAQPMCVCSAHHRLASTSTNTQRSRSASIRCSPGAMQAVRGRCRLGSRLLWGGFLLLSSERRTKLPPTATHTTALLVFICILSLLHLPGRSLRACIIVPSLAHRPPLLKSKSAVVPLLSCE